MGQARCPRALSTWGGVTLEGLPACPSCSCSPSWGRPRDSCPAVAELSGKAELFQGGFKTLFTPHPATDLPGNAILLLHTMCLLDPHPVLCPPHPRRNSLPTHSKTPCHTQGALAIPGDTISVHNADTHSEPQNVPMGIPVPPLGSGAPLQFPSPLPCLEGIHIPGG